MKRALLALIAVLSLGLALPAWAELRRVQATGQAVSTGLGADVTRRRALQEALIEAALSAGVDVNGYAASASSVLTADQLVVRPSARILGYTVLSEGKSGDFYRVTVEAYVGEPIRSDICAKRAAVKAVAYRPAVSVDLRAPVWLEGFGAALATQVQDALLRSENGQLTRSEALGPVGLSMSRAPREMDYASLTQRRQVVAASAPPRAGLSITAQLSLALTGGDHAGARLALSLTLRLIDTATLKLKAQRQLALQIPLGTVLPLRSLNQMLRKDTQKLLAQMMPQIEAEIEGLLGRYRCAPLVAPLDYANGQLSLPFGTQDGVTKNMLAYTDRGDQPFLLFRILDLQENRVTLATIDPSSDARRLQGVPAQLMADSP